MNNAHGPKELETHSISRARVGRRSVLAHATKLEEENKLIEAGFESIR